MMDKSRTAILTGIAALAVAGVGLAAIQDTHTVKVDLPGGAIARIEYSGEVTPKVMFAPVTEAIPVGLGDEFDSAPVAAFDQIAAEMDRQAAVMIHRAAQLQALPVLAQGKLETAALEKLPTGSVHYEFVSTSSGSGACTRSLEMTSYGPDQKPVVVSTSSGDCKPQDRTPAPVRLDTPARPSMPGVANGPEQGRVSTIV